MPVNTYAGQTFHIRPTYIVSLPDFTGGSSRFSQERVKNQVNLLDNSHKGLISKKAATRIRNSIAWMYSSAKRKRVFDRKTNKGYYFKLNFITLTLSAAQGELSDNDFKVKMLRSFLNMCSYNKGLKNYFWRVEPQANGSIHAHIITDTFLHMKDIQRYWNKVQAKYGFIDKFEAKHGHRNPPSTHVRAIRNDNDLAAYIADYVGKKQEGRRLINGKLWATNYRISNANKCTLYTGRDEVGEVLKCLDNPEIEYKTIESQPDSFGKTYTFGELFLIRPAQWETIIKGQLKEVYNNHRFHIRHGLEKIPLTYLVN